ncbi:hypothetical protein AB0A95_33865 [Micromonospora sp. NPDC049230]|uniref:hypothetical protein n=1 Tax=Micromonospora sp. NPDC049230 TaxID=3155502 RepID=UPI0033F92DEE
MKAARLKAGIIRDAITAATSAIADAIADRRAGRSPTQTQTTIAEPDRLAAKLIEQRDRGERP